MYTLGLDTIAGAKILQVKFGTAGAFQPGQTVLHKERRARIIRISADTAAIRYWGESDEVAVPPEAHRSRHLGGRAADQCSVSAGCRGDTAPVAS